MTVSHGKALVKQGCHHQVKEKNTSMTAWFKTARGPWETYSLWCVLFLIGFFFMQIFCLVTSLMCLNHCLWESVLNGSRTWMDPKLWIFLMFFFWFFNPCGSLSWHANEPLTAVFKKKNIARYACLFPRVIFIPRVVRSKANLSRTWGLGAMC